MTITETRTPHEFLARWDEETGVFRGAHIQFYDSVLRDGVRVAGSLSKAFGVGDGLAFPLADIMSTITQDALALIESQTTQIAMLTADKAAAESTRDAAQSQIAELQSQLVALQPPSDVNGIPQVISKKQGREQLKAELLLSHVESYIFSLAAEDDTRMAYEDSATWIRTDPSVVAMMTMLGKTDADADAFFAAAAAR